MYGETLIVGFDYVKITKNNNQKYLKSFVYLRIFMESETLIAGLCRKKYGNIQLKVTKGSKRLVKTVTVDMSCEDSGHIKQDPWMEIGSLIVGMNCEITRKIKTDSTWISSTLPGKLKLDRWTRI
ncbi:hypothetical protein PHYBLDRAFT_163534 [Phycomyces blakesleeanus NRRL 1555(-)]|uniref:Uncharacterized protein n=1 Tax=Phycomyces blakesleeanus (strain ATCC 8743b / DSM 1359 / FGSC 10004 / NBRC 33097 / NRRL 1555) TaxID=763407 RepID=A0A163B5T1_PHYB8|nr:hypothetical protein PHYBLDRAFT_163534 [Phycomyces blakesleeanus NRRL 1555(-)]OAD78421.1 hypothetical protein PHYBLDRAFT_163534 [Phycomyces blakesleeanus NRRL 1555(-)]|eukprot:XP_018296461.1 hypothetical protein PHYBLDRAFT_163534 [Phycomyces blakesleeanus NRRL 1555(-)]